MASVNEETLPDTYDEGTTLKPGSNMVCHSYNSADDGDESEIEEGTDEEDDVYLTNSDSDSESNRSYLRTVEQEDGELENDSESEEEDLAEESSHWSPSPPPLHGFFESQELTQIQREEHRIACKVTNRIAKDIIDAQRENVMSEFQDADLFLVDGDSLLFEIVYEDQTLSWACGGQYLHLTYLAERFLQLFIQRGGIFHIIFFKEMEKIWSCRPIFALARRCLMQHLKHNTKLTVVTNIDSYWAPEWKQYIQMHRPAFLLLAESPDLKGLNIKTRRRHHFLMDSREARFMFQTLLNRTLSLDLKCVFISGIEFAARGAFGFYIQPTLLLKKIFEKRKERIRSVWDLVVKRRGENLTANYVERPHFLNSELIQGLSPFLRDPVPGGLRAIVYIPSVADLILCSTEENFFPKEQWPLLFGVMKVFILHLLMLEKLPLKYRAQPNRGADFAKFEMEDGSVDLVTALHLIIRELRLRLCRSMDLLQQMNYRVGGRDYSESLNHIADILDGRLFLALLVQCFRCQYQGREVSVPPRLLEDTKNIWSAVMRMVQSKQDHASVSKTKGFEENSFLPVFTFSVTIKEDCVVNEGVGQNQDQSEEDQRIQTSDRFDGLMPVDNQLVEDFVGKTRTGLKTLDL